MYKTYLMLTMLLICCLSRVQAQSEVEAHLKADLVSEYNWRGLDLGKASVQPELSVGWKGLSLTAWGSVGLTGHKDDLREIDLTLSYETGGFEFGIFGEESDDLFYYLTPFDAFVCIMGAILVAGIGHFIMPHEPQIFQNEVRQIATDVTRIYLIHWVFVCYPVGGIMDGVLDLYPDDISLLLVGLCILAASAWLARRKPFSLIKI